MPTVHDCLIIGAGPAGLVAATYLARFRRDVAVVDAGGSRAALIPTSHNCPGFPAGVSGDRLLQRLGEQARNFGVEVQPGRIESLARDGNGFVARDADGRDRRARLVVLATGVVDRLPPMEGGDAARQSAIDAGVLRLCAVCDGYEATDVRIGVLAPADAAIAHGVFLRTFSQRVDAIRSHAGDPGAEARRRAGEANVELLPAPTRLHCDDKACRVVFADGSERTYDTVYPLLGSDNQSQLALSLGAAVDAEGALQTDAHQQTTVDGLYAIGDVVSALNQIAVAVGHAAIAATAIHNRLPWNPR
jgi:thioredoxin reductase (NADPH)